ncbi:Hypothetical predicted protein [Mytilus galloprovincialis]|uniref:C1q domain-containing protein n=1 Tax=Mytilus galloprovincialis TaxID=29158 RepID=A0A8B6FDE5_MYTGA|nr:Hypothetical predicted protein [Mytilus galloprovincialis]
MSLLFTFAGHTIVTFLARLVTPDYGTIAAKATLKFEKTTENVGNGYDNKTGIFTAPIKGLYHFTASARQSRSGYLHLGLYRNDEEMAVSVGVNYNSLTIGATFTLKSGEHVLRIKKSTWLEGDDTKPQINESQTTIGIDHRQPTKTTDHSTLHITLKIGIDHRQPTKTTDHSTLHITLKIGTIIASPPKQQTINTTHNSKDWISSPATRPSTTITIATPPKQQGPFNRHNTTHTLKIGLIIASHQNNRHSTLHISLKMGLIIASPTKTTDHSTTT